MSVFGADTVMDSNRFYKAILTCVDSNGFFRWTLATQNAETRLMSGSIVADALGNVYQIGWFGVGDISSSGPAVLRFGGHALVDSYDRSGYYYLTKVDTAGNVKWLKRLLLEQTSSASWGYPISGGIAMDAFGSIYVCGTFAADTTWLGSTVLTNAGSSTSDIFVAKLDTGGNPVWVRHIGGNSVEYNVSLAVAPRGDVYVVGKYLSGTLSIGGTTLTNTTSPPTGNLFVARYDSAGNAKWAKGIPNACLYENCTIAADVFNNVYIGGVFSGAITFGSHSLSNPGTAPHMYVASYDSAGNVRWAKKQSNPLDFITYSIAPDACGKIWISGGGASSSSSEPTFLVLYDTAGHALDSLSLPVGGDDDNGIAVDNNGNLYVCGDYLYATTIGATTLALVDSEVEAFFVAKYKYSFTHCIPPIVTLGSQVEELTNSDDITLYPNPATDEVNIQSATSLPPGSKIVICDMAGRLVAQCSLSGNMTVVNTEQLGAGMYLCNLYAGHERVATRKLVITR
jgi:hypothetical protein